LLSHPHNPANRLTGFESARAYASDERAYRGMDATIGCASGRPCYGAKEITASAGLFRFAPVTERERDATARAGKSVPYCISPTTYFKSRQRLRCRIRIILPIGPQDLKARARAKGASGFSVFVVSSMAHR